MLYVPVSFVTAVETTPVSTFVAVTVTPGIKAFAASETVPPRLALLDWLKPTPVMKISRGKIAARCDLLIHSSPEKEPFSCLECEDYIRAEEPRQCWEITL